MKTVTIEITWSDWIPLSVTHVLNDIIRKSYRPHSNQWGYPGTVQGLLRRCTWISSQGLLAGDRSDDPRRSIVFQYHELGRYSAETEPRYIAVPVFFLFECGNMPVLEREREKNGDRNFSLLLHLHVCILAIFLYYSFILFYSLSCFSYFLFNLRFILSPFRFGHILLLSSYIFLLFLFLLIETCCFYLINLNISHCPVLSDPVFRKEILEHIDEIVYSSVSYNLKLETSKETRLERCTLQSTQKLWMATVTLHPMDVDV